MSIVGNTSKVLSYIFLGPAAFVHMQTKLSIIRGMVVLEGFGHALVTVSAFGRAQSAALKLGYSDDINTKFIIAGKIIL